MAFNEDLIYRIYAQQEVTDIKKAEQAIKMIVK